MNVKSWGIQRRAVFLALAPTVAIATVLAGYFLIVRYGDVEEALQNRGQALVRQLAPAAEYGAFSGNRLELSRLAQSTAREPDVVAVAIYDSSGRLLASAGDTAAVATSALDGKPLTVGGSRAVETFHAMISQPALPFDDPFLDPHTGAGTAPPLGKVVIELSRANLQARKQEILGVTLLITIMVLIGALLLARRIGRDVIEPVLALEDAVSRVRGGSLGVRITPHASGTLQSLETGFNEMAETLDAGRQRSASALADTEAELARQLEIAKLKKEEAERASDAKSRFLAAASHDLRQPLHALTLFATELLPRLSKTRDRQLAAQIVTAAGAIAELLDALLDMSRLDIAAVQPHRRAIALEPLLESVAEAHRQSAKTKGLRVSCRATSLWADSDPQLLRRMIGNLVANAVRYTERGGVLLAARKRGTRVLIEVWDTGIGIGEEHLPFLFHEFYQIGNPERDATKGLGLGLTIVARLGDILDHPVGVQSRVGRGSVFSVSVPVASAEAEQAAAPPNVLAFRSRILVRSTDVGLCGDLCTLLDAWGYERQCVCSEAEIEAALASDPAVVISDVASLPPIIERLPEGDNRPRLLVLGEDEEVKKSGIAADGRLSLPPRPARLRALLHHLLEETEETP